MGSFLLSAIQLMRADRPVGTVLLACPMLWALWLAGDGQPPANIVFIFLIGAFIMRSAGCVVNDFADRDIDLKVKRTKDRPLTTGRISTTAAMSVFAVLILMALGLLFFLPKSAILPAVVAFVLSTLYPFTKRFFIVPQLILGLAFSTAILMAYLVLGASVPVAGWLLFVAATLWTVVYDTFYAMVDRDDDQNLGIHSSALWFAEKDLLICFILALVFMGLMVVVGSLSNVGAYYYLGLLLAACCFIYQFRIVRQRDRQACLTAFLNNQWVGVLIFLGILLDGLA